MRITLSMFFGAAIAAVVAVPAVALADGDAAKGAKVFKKCAACHTATEAKNKVGPHLVGIIDRPMASVEDYKYSKAMTEHAAEVPAWTVEALDAYLRNPKGVVKGTKMAFAGLKKDDDVENVIAYLMDPAAAE
ncbi:c-type cytochrome [Hoeflea sp.]|uniref:c-type cytochrome n=1 Tax=Hoeflea sp. TaxID=1940281 RepID=UPI003A94F2BC